MTLSRLTSSCILLAWLALPAAATPLTPDQALQAALQGPGVSTASRIKGSHMELKYTAMADGQAGVYLFAAAGDKPGLMAVAADDAMKPLLLGYSDNASFSPDRMPPALLWWLQRNADAVAARAQASAPTSARPLLPARPRTARQPIAPMLTTQWDQDSPYNDECPLFNGQRAVTGCSATAMAQVAKYHQWPVTGTGTHTYTFDYNGKTYSETFDFGATTFEWSKMLDTYTGSATNRQKAAVATLMHACGVACNMSYSPESSGATSLEAAYGLVNFMGYDKGISMQESAWYSPDEWTDLVYSQLADGMPAYYFGYTPSGGGHAFVCDGWNDGYFHINWGWSGAADGYYLLTNLTPEFQGIGGFDEGYTDDTGILMNMRKPVAGSKVDWILAFYESLPISDGVYPRNDETVWNLPSVYSMTYTAGTFEVALEFVDTQGQSQWVELGNIDIQPYQGFSIGLATSWLPEGEYDMYIAYDGGNGWQRAKYPRQANGSIHFTADASTVTVSESSQPVEPTADLTATLVKTDATDMMLTPGEEYVFTFRVDSSDAWQGDLYCLLCDDTYLYAYSDPISFTFTGAASKRATWTLAVPDDIDSGSYVVGLAYYVEGQGFYLLDNYSYVTVGEASQGELEAFEVNFVGSGSAGWEEGSPAVLPSASPVIEATVGCTAGHIADNICIVFAENDGNYDIIAETGSQSVDLSAGDTATLRFTGPWSGLSPNTTYIMALWGDDYGQIGYIYFVRFETVTNQGGVVGMVMGDDSSNGYFADQPAVLNPERPTIGVEMQCLAGTWWDEISLLFGDLNMQLVSETAAETVSLYEGQKQVIEFVGPWDGIEPDEVYCVMPYSYSYGSQDALRYFIIPSDPSRLDSAITTPGETTAPAEWFDLMGRRINAPVPGSVCVQRTPSGSAKLLIRTR